MALSMTMLCICWGVYFWGYFDVAFYIVDWSDYPDMITTCASSDGIDFAICQMYAANGVLVLLAAIVTIIGGFCRYRQELNQAHMAAAFSLLNLALAVFWFVLTENWDFQGDKKVDFKITTVDDLEAFSENMMAVIGAVHALGFIFGVAHLGCLCCCEAGKGNNFLYVISVFCYLMALVMTDYHWLDEFDCSTDVKENWDNVKDEVEKAADEGSTHSYSDACAAYAISGSVLLLGALACLIALLLAFFQDAKRQGKVQQFALAFAVGMACLSQATRFWLYFSEGYSNGKFLDQKLWFTYNDCESEDIFDSGACTAWALGGIISLAGFPFAMFTALAFACGCYSEDEDQYQKGHEVAGNRNVGSRV